MSEYEAPDDLDNPYEAPQAPIREQRRRREDSLPLASRGARWGAQMLNGIFMVIIGAIAFFLLSLLGFAEEIDAEDIFETYSLLLVVVLPWVFLNIYFIVTRSQSIGKIMLGIKVVRDDGTPASGAHQIFVRWMVPQVIGAIVPFFGLVDVLFIFGKDYQCIHDKIAKTTVIRANVPAARRRRTTTRRQEDEWDDDEI